MRDQIQSSEEEGTHEDLTEFAVRLNQRQQAFVIQLDHLPRLDDANPSETPAPGERVYFTRELTGAKNGDERIHRARGTDNFDLAGGHHKERYETVSLFDYDLAGPGRT